MPENATTPGSFGLFKDELAPSLRVAHLERCTLRMLKLARSKLIYLMLGIHQVELRRRCGERVKSPHWRDASRLADAGFKQRLGVSVQFAHLDF